MMNKYKLKGNFWYAGDNVFIETAELNEIGLPTEVCLNDFLKENIKENTKITVVINVKTKPIKRKNFNRREKNNDTKNL